MSRIGEFPDDDVAGWILKSPDIGTAMAGFSQVRVWDRILLIIAFFAATIVAMWAEHLTRLPMRVRELARAVIAHDNECEVCINTRDADGPAAGVDEDLYAHALEWRTWPGFTDQERIAAEFAHRFGTEHTKLRDDEDFWARCGEHFSEELLADLALSCAMWVGMGRMLRTLDIGQSCTITLPSRA